MIRGDAQVRGDYDKGGCSLLRYERQICRGRAAAARRVLGWTESHFVASKVIFVCWFLFKATPCLFFVCLCFFVCYPI